MKWPPFCVPQLAVLLLLVANGAPAQEAQQDTLRGQLVYPDAPPTNVTFRVTLAEDSSRAGEFVLTGMTMMFEGEAFPFSNVRLREKALSFSFEPGDRPVACVLVEQEDGGYEGECGEGVNEALLKMTMAPLKTRPEGGRPKNEPNR